MVTGVAMGIWRGLRAEAGCLRTAGEVVKGAGASLKAPPQLR